MTVRSHTKILFFILALISLAGCSGLTDIKTSITETVFGREPVDPPEELVEFTPTRTAKILWSANVGEAAGYDFTPVVEAGVAYAASADGSIVKIDVVKGTQIWRINTNQKITGGVGAGGGLVLVGAANGNVLAYDVAGKALWTSRLSSEILSAPQYFDGTVVVRTNDNRIYGVNAEDGSRKWVYERTSPTLSLRSSAGVVIDSGAVYAGFAGGKLISIRADNGKLLWEASVAQPKGVTEIERIADITSMPVVDGPLVYAVAYQGRIAAVDRVSGRVVWNRDISSLAGLYADAAKIFVSHTIGSVYSLDYTTGKTFWRQAQLKNRNLTAPIAVSDLVAVGDLEGYIHFLNREDGAQAVRISTDKSQVMPRLIKLSEDSFLAQTKDGGLYAIQVK